MSKTAENKKLHAKAKVTTKNVHDGHRERMREKFRKNGFNGMADHEVLEMLLFYCVSRSNTNGIAHELINHFGSLSAVFEAPEEELMKVKGVGANSAFLIKMILPLYREYKVDSGKSKTLKTPEECGEYLVNYFSSFANERVVVLCLDGSCRILGIEEICEGDVSSVTVNMRKMISSIVKYPATVAVVLSHNHPGSLALPSRDDVKTTSDIKKTLDTLGITLVDHIIVADDEYVSMASSAGFGSIFK